MAIMRNLYVTFLVIRYSLLPPRRQGTSGAGSFPDNIPAVAPQMLPLLFADLTSAVTGTGTLRLFFPGCLAPAAPCLLFRLKRSGFSACRATMTPEGLLLTAIR